MSNSAWNPADQTAMSPGRAQLAAAHPFSDIGTHDPSKLRGYTAPTLCGLLSDNKPLPDQLRTASEQLRGMLMAGELDALSEDTKLVFVALAMFLNGAAARVGER